MTRVVTFAVDEQVMRLPPPIPQTAATVDPVGLCIFTRSQIRMFTLRERLLHVKVNVSWDFSSPSSNLFLGCSYAIWVDSAPPMGFHNMLC
jgi:hypothetical protein